MEKNNMNYKDFLSEIQKHILEYLPEWYEDADVSIHKIIKNNNTENMALIIRRPGKEISPIVYLEQFFKQYQAGKSIKESIEHIVDIYLHNQTFDITNLTELVSDFEKVQSLLRLQLVNKDYNNEELHSTPCVDLGSTNLTAIFRIYLPIHEESEANILVSNNMLSKWNKTIDDLYPIALQNTMLANPAKIVNLIHIANAMTDETMKNEVENFQIKPYEQYVLSNSSGWNGAAVLLYPGIMEQLAKSANANLFIMPSSIHEVIVMQDTGELEAKELQKIVMSINYSTVSPENRLSDEVYYYNKNEHCLSIATDKEETKELKSRLMQIDVTEMEQVAEMEMEE